MLSDGFWRLKYRFCYFGCCCYVLVFVAICNVPDTNRMNLPNIILLQLGTLDYTLSSVRGHVEKLPNENLKFVLLSSITEQDKKLVSFQS